MKKIQLTLITSLLATGIAHAAAPCNGFEIVIKNNLQNNLIGSMLKLDGAAISPMLVGIDSKSEKTFTVSGSKEETPMKGEMVFKTLSLPSETIHIKFDLTNQILFCQHTDNEIQNVSSVTHYRLPTKVIYTIG